MATERKIGAHVYRCEKLPASEGLTLFLRVTKFFAAAPDMVVSILAGSSDKNAMSAMFTLALSEATNHKESHDLIVDLAQTCRVNGDACIVGVKPQGLEDLVQVAWFAMEVNFRDFLAGSLVDESPPRAGTAAA